MDCRGGAIVDNFHLDVSSSSTMSDCVCPSRLFHSLILYCIVLSRAILCCTVLHRTVPTLCVQTSSQIYSILSHSHNSTPLGLSTSFQEFVSREGKKYDNPAHQSQRKMKLKQVSNITKMSAISFRYLSLSLSSDYLTYSLPPPLCILLPNFSHHTFS